MDPPRQSADSTETMTYQLSISSAWVWRRPQFPVFADRLVQLGSCNW